MSRIFISGSADGLGQMCAKLLIDAGHHVVLHGRSEQRAQQALDALPGAQAAVFGDLASIAQTTELAAQLNRLGSFDAVIHNAAVGYREPQRIETEDGLSHVFAVNSLSPYILTALMHKPGRLVYLSSGMHRGADASLEDLNWERRRWSGSAAYADSKLHNVILAFAMACKWPDVLSNSLEPGWVPTKMGGSGAPDDMQAAPVTQAWLAGSDDAAAKVTGKYFYHMKRWAVDAAASDIQVQQRLLDEYRRLSGVALPMA
ncbi:SDR family NAD(P)-dependent oxidoreductase [Undibacterium sp. TJN25]|uniref:SDR family NAD(P)-dependent oxidoreductase n=1 Tax=Undibacterium sp. TJN25 TaxID=3413056 RepID=UPI003BEF6288